MTWLRRNVFDILDILKFLGILLLVLMFIHFNTTVARQAKETQAIASSTNRVVKSQDDILRAIKQVTVDTQLTAQQQTAIIICMLQVPVESRTTDLQAQCRSQATSGAPATPGALSVSAPQSSSSVSGVVPSAQSAPNTSNKQATTSQPASNPQPTTLDKIPLLGDLFKAAGL